MTKALVKLQSRLQSEKGATAVEYGLFVALIAAVIIGLVVTLGESISDAFTSINSQMP
ncbi:Flp family type IVb pilin [Phycicoccus sp. BSK3Z-2]|uniref:Flp family type IVb pilin n=1 Tax=Phycicoccus avicenniae TaxID=2828860 RepID=A0A941DA45_9MICO|nr:Flp family type IVb pilin [Phycicoccus avicenniae]MBR7743913.1 Flp family type IVb pilin [Phycicoccus avicenniae]